MDQVMNDMKNKVAIVTGGGAGIGSATARRFVDAGAKVLVTGRRASALDTICAGNPNIEGFVADAAEPLDVPLTIAKAVELW